MFKHIDFAPNKIEDRRFGKAPVFESLKDVEAIARDWVRRNGYKVINVETLLLPLNYKDDGTTDTEFSAWVLKTTSFQPFHPWIQAIRVWYDDET